MARTKVTQLLMPSELGAAVTRVRAADTSLTAVDAVRLIAVDDPMAAAAKAAHKSNAPLVALAQWWLEASEVHAAQARVNDAEKRGLPADFGDALIAHLGYVPPQVPVVAAPSETLKVAIADAGRRFGCRSDAVKTCSYIVERTPSCDYGADIASEALGWMDHLLGPSFGVGGAR